VSGESFPTEKKTEQKINVVTLDEREGEVKNNDGVHERQKQSVEVDNKGTNL